MVQANKQKQALVMFFRLLFLGRFKCNEVTVFTTTAKADKYSFVLLTISNTFPSPALVIKLEIHTLAIK